MNLFRRILLVFAALLFSAHSASSQRTAPPADAASSYLVYIGTYTDKTASKGIYAYRYDAASGKLSDLGLAAETANPSWLAVHPNKQFLYAVNESGKNSTVSAFHIDYASGRLTLLNQVSAHGEDPCYLSFDRTGKYVFVTNYTSGNVVIFPVDTEGKLGEATANLRDEGKVGPAEQQKDGPHAHWVEADRLNRFVYVADLGLDRVLRYDFNPANGTLANTSRGSKWAPGEKAKDPSAKLVAGTGPRHAVFSYDRVRLYILGELKSTVTVFRMIGTDLFTPTSSQLISALPKRFSGRNDAAEIALHPTEDFLYTSNRGLDTIAVFRVNRGQLLLVDNVSTGGKEPRHFAIDPAGRFLLAENQLSDNIVEFRIDPATGKLAPTGEVISTPSPVCLVFVPLK
jgi:6-phosphogluconolactonase